MSHRTQDAVVIGGGFYGTVIANYLARTRGFRHMVLVEKQNSLLSRASYNNQARIHNGYHYPRSFTTAYRSRVNFRRFLLDWPSAVKSDFTKLYAIARNNSKCTAKQFEHFSRKIGAKIWPAEESLCKLFDPRLIESVFLAEEYSFNSVKLARILERELAENHIQIYFQTEVTKIWKGKNGILQTILQTQDGREKQILSKYVFNCSYSGLNQLGGDFLGVTTSLKHEITEMSLLQVPPVLREFGITVMDGPFFSLMPFPARDLHTLSHVRYTPHLHWDDQKTIKPDIKIKQFECATRTDRMLRDAARYLPVMADAKYIDSLYEIKTLLVKNESDDGRPILFEKHKELPGCYSILGGKIDNIYDVLEKLDAEKLTNVAFTNGANTGGEYD